MFSVIFEALPNKENWDDYLDNAKMLRPELEQVDGFIDNIRYKSLTREGWILSLSAGGTRRRSCAGVPGCAITRSSRRAATKFSLTTTCGRPDHADTHVPQGSRAPGAAARRDPREGTTVTLINGRRAEWKQTNNPYDCADGSA